MRHAGSNCRREICAARGRVASDFHTATQERPLLLGPEHGVMERPHLQIWFPFPSVTLSAVRCAGSARDEAPLHPRPLSHEGRGEFFCVAVLSGHMHPQIPRPTAPVGRSCVLVLLRSSGGVASKQSPTPHPSPPCGRGAGGEGAQVRRFTTAARSSPSYSPRHKTAPKQRLPRESSSSVQPERAPPRGNSERCVTGGRC
jgi:hypothetical protein